MFGFQCNICLAVCEVPEFENLDRESTSCLNCGSNVRFRWLVDALSNALFGKSLTLPDFPVRKNIVGLGLSDWGVYAKVLSERFDYQNTFFDTEPIFDITRPDESSAGRYDFIVATEVFEHVVPPVQVAFDNLFKISKPGASVIFSVPWAYEQDAGEHFPDLYDWNSVKLNSGYLVVNRRRDGKLEIFENPIFHGGPGSTLEMRKFSKSQVESCFKQAGFESITFAEPNREFGIYFKEPWAHPCVAIRARSAAHATEPDRISAQKAAEQRLC